MDELQAALARIAAVRGDPAAVNVCLDCWRLAQRDGEAAGLALAAVVLGNVREMALRGIVARTDSPAGVVLGTRPVPRSGGWATVVAELKTKTRVDVVEVPPGKAVPTGAVLWCEAGGAGWWRVPAATGGRHDEEAA